MRIVFMLAAMAAVAGPALAQPAATIAVEGGVSHRTNWRFDGCDECPALTREFGGEVAFLATDSLAVLGGVGLTFYDIDFLSDYITGLEVGLKELTVSTGLRYYGPPGRARFFAEVEVGVNRVTGAFELLGVARVRFGHRVQHRAGCRCGHRRERQGGSAHIRQLGHRTA